MRIIMPITYLLVIAGAMLTINACDNTGTNDPPDEKVFDRPAMLEHIGNNIILPAYQAFQESVNALESAVGTFAGDPTTANLQTVQNALKEARLSWQHVNLFQFGPAETVALRGVINTYPADTGQINANINSGNYMLGSIENLAAGGFPAIDFLIHGEDLSSGQIQALFTTDQNAAMRMKYLQDNISFIKTNVDFVAEQWAMDGGNYISTFLSTGKAGTDVGSALGELVNAMVLHFERFTRDGKIGIPAGVRSAGVPRPRTTEAFYGGYSVKLGTANLAAIDRLFKGIGADGQDGPGLEENLQFLNASNLAADINLSLEESLNVMNGLSDPLNQQINTDLDKVISTFTKMQELLVLIKVDMTSLLGITITYQDNDGD